MAAFSFYGTDTSGGGWGWDNYGTALTYTHPANTTGFYVMPYTPLATPTISQAERNRRALARVQAPPRPGVSSTVASRPLTTGRSVLVPRRTTVVRGTVSFARQGGRRPL